MNIKVCEDCAECKTIKGKACCYEMFDKPIEEVEECPLGVELSEIDELNQKAKDNKVSVGAKSENRKKTTREVKIDEEKVEIVAKLAEFCENFAEMVEITNKTKIIEFNVGENHYKLDLIKTRKPKK